MFNEISKGIENGVFTGRQAEILFEEKKLSLKEFMDTVHNIENTLDVKGTDLDAFSIYMAYELGKHVGKQIQILRRRDNIDQPVSVFTNF